MTASLRSVLEALADNRVRLSYEDETGEFRTREFWAPRDGGYVYEESGANHGTLDQQVCAGLSSRGWVLRWSPSYYSIAKGDYVNKRAVDVIRSEYLVMRRAEKKRWG